MRKRRIQTIDMVYMAFFAILMSVCAWISIPFGIPFTLQTFGIFVTLGFLGGKFGTLSIVLYVVLGAVGLPVFSGFSGGVGKLMGPTGGYIIGFVFAGLIYWLITKIAGTKLIPMVVGMMAGLITCYGFGTFWFLIVYTKNVGTISVGGVLSICVIPFIIPDLIKLALGVLLVKRIEGHMQMQR